MKIVRRRLKDGSIREYRYRRRKRARPGSIGGLVQEYRQSPEFEALAPNTKAVYMRAIGHMHKLYDSAIVDIRRRHVIKLRDKFRKTPAIANQIVAVFSRLMNYAVVMEYRTDNPAYMVGKLEGGHYERWPDDAVDYALTNLPGRFQRAIILALYTGQRQGDVLRMTWSDYDGEGIVVTQQKTGAALWVPCHAVLKAHLDDWKATRTATTILVDSRGRPYDAKSFNTLFAREARKHVELTGLVFHGLRKTAAAKLAEAGCTTHEIASITGHQTLAMLQEYTRGAEQRQRAKAAILKLENKAENTSGKRTKNAG